MGLPRGCGALGVDDVVMCADQIGLEACADGIGRGGRRVRMNICGCRAITIRFIYIQ